ncbi:MAG TPA: amino acid adenylation domain-containing protein [Candidatus Angelobacter sp.]|nr:amino acid adenylation domain-containing protein [Candidatus Angelobacter sp.]
MAGSNPTISKLFDEQVRRHPEATALMHGNRKLTYREISGRVNQLARYLQRFGVGPEIRVAICAERSFETSALLLAIIKAGGAYVPIEPTFPPKRTAGILASAGARLLIAQMRSPAFDSFKSKILLLPEHEAAISRESAAEFDQSGDTRNLIAVLFTSGTTGEPKGIAIPMSAAMNQIDVMWNHCAFQSSDVSLLHRSFTVIGSLWENFGPLVHGIPSMILSGDDARDPATIWACLAEKKITHFVLTPALANHLIRYGERHHLRSACLRFSMMYGEPVQYQTIARWNLVFPNSRLYICYGTTEASYIAMLDTSQLQGEETRLPAGPTFHKGAVRIVSETMDLVEEGAGEICVASGRIARGYLNDPQLTAERFIPDPWAASPGEVLYRTGDLGRWKPGAILEMLGRVDRQIKVHGFRVELDEIEAALLRVSGAPNTAVLVLDDAQQRKVLVAYLETSDSIDSEALRNQLRRVLPEYMLPSFFVAMNSFPLTSSGKLDRRSLPEPSGLRSMYQNAKSPVQQTATGVAM